MIASNGVREFMEAAIQLSIEKMEEGFGGPFGAVVVRDCEIIGRGYNQVTSANDPTCHAEIVAIREACRKLQSFQLTGCDMYASCEPCPMCFGAINWARLDRVFYGNTRHDAADIGFDDEFLYRELNKSPEARAIPMLQMMREEAFEAFRLWDAKEDKIPY